MSKRPISNGIRAGLAVVLATAGLSGLSWAQDAVEEEEGAELDRVQVTGSRIRRADTEGSKPILRISREDIENSGLTSLGRLLQELSISGSAINTGFNSSGNFGFPSDGGGIGAGSTQLNLRGLGSNRTLILVNGQRWVPGASASGVAAAVDLNTIPITSVESIEVLKDGASTIYGADAIAGVVNIITRSDFSGLEMNAYGGQFVDEEDGAQQQYDLSFGQTGERSQVFFNLSFTDQSDVEAGDRALSRFPVPGTGLTRGSSGTPQGRFIFDIPGVADSFGGLCSPIDTNDDGTPDASSCDVTTPRGSVFPGGVPQFPNDFIPFSNEERFNFAPFNLVQTPSERISLWVEGRYDFMKGGAANISGYSRFLFNNRESTNRAAPEPLFFGPGAGFGNAADFTNVDQTNPFNPFGITLDATENFVLLGRRPIEAGPRLFRQDVDTWYFNSGLQGDFVAANRMFNWDMNVVFSENEASQTKNGAFRLDRLGQALGPVEDCVGALNGCVPLNLFGGQQGDEVPRFNGGGGSITQEMLDFIGFVQKDSSKQELFDFNLNFAGDLIELPAGWVGFAVGYEHRDQEGSFSPDPIVAAGDSNGIPAQPTTGDFDVDSFYGEVVVPLLSEMPLARLLEVSGSVRVADFSTFGSETTAKVELRWQPFEQLLLRGTYSEGFRAPSIGELFGSEARFDEVLNDPCNTNNFPNLSADQQQTCMAEGVPQGGNIQTNTQISVTTGGNENLDAETADSYSAGFLYSATWVENIPAIDVLDLGVSWYRHELDDAIRAVDAQFLLDECIRTGDDSFCDNIERNATGTIAGFDNRLTNIGGIETEGWDFTVNVRGADTGFGRFGLDWNTTFIDEFDEIVPSAGGGFQALDRTGVEFNNASIVEWRSNANFLWDLGSWSAVWTIQYIDSLTESCSDFLDGTPDSLANLGLCTNPEPTQLDGFGEVPTNKLGSTTYHDVNLSYDTQIMGTGARVTIGAENLFDRDPPACRSCSLNGYDPSTFRIPGRFLYARVGLRF
ncbi:MAG: TonB-dependent receptor [Wenzhouxiangellaceae bacterium]|nr:TonB-dependent receptor [Wenzhouxiangellaceae bacterium]